MIIGVTLFFVIVDIKKHREETVNITTVDVRKAMKNRINASSADKNNNAILNTARSPVPSDLRISKRA